MKRIILTGGGTAGHVTPNIALIPKLQEMDYEIHYIGTYTGIEKKLIEDLGIPYYGISSGKFRRYFSLKNFSDPFRVIKGYGDAVKLMKKLKPDVVFSKGGFVSVPVVLAAHHKKIPVVIHESDMSPGLANKIALPDATKVCCNFPETLEALPEGKAVVTGTPIREELFNGNAADAMTFCGFTEVRPTILIVGGSTGSANINEAIWSCLDELLTEYNVIHICGKDKTNSEYTGKKGYAQFDYVKKELSSMLALCDVIVSRAGANAICELLALKKPNILIPLSAEASRGDQILNAASFEKSGYSKVIQDKDLNRDTLISAIHEVIQNKEPYINAMKNSGQTDSITMITTIIDDLANEHIKKLSES